MKYNVSLRWCPGNEVLSLTRKIPVIGTVLTLGFFAVGNNPPSQFRVVGTSFNSKLCVPFTSNPPASAITTFTKATFRDKIVVPATELSCPPTTNCPSMLAVRNSGMEGNVPPTGCVSHIFESSRATLRTGCINPLLKSVLAVTKAIFHVPAATVIES